MKFSTMAKLLNMVDELGQIEGEAIITIVRNELSKFSENRKIFFNGAWYTTRHPMSVQTLTELYNNGLWDRKLAAFKQHRMENPRLSLPDAKRQVEDFMRDNRLGSF